MSWLVIVAIGIVTYLLRISFMVGQGKKQNEKFRRGLRFVPVAVISPLAVSAVTQHGSGAFELRLFAAAVALVVSWRTRNAAAAMTAGMIVLWMALWLSF